MDFLTYVLLFVAGIGGGLLGSVAGLASLATYPALLAVGLPPVTANVTNTVALIFSTVGSVAGSRPELKGQGRLLRQAAPIALGGGVIGCVLLLTTPAEGFEKVVPALLAFASLTILLPRRVKVGNADAATEQARHSQLRLTQGVGIFFIGVYGGYFGAAAGVLMLALLLHSTGISLPRANAAKNVLLGAANIIAALGFMILAPVAWAAVLPLGAGVLLGARVGPILVRRASPTPLRILIGIAGFALAVKLAWQAW